MKIEKIGIEYASKSGFSSKTHDMICHTKVLPYLSVVQAIEGSYDIQLDFDESCNTGRSGFFVAPSNVRQRIVHNADPLSKNMVCRWVFLKISINDVYSLDDIFSFPTVLPEKVREEMNEVFDSLFDTKNIFDEYLCYHRIIKLLCEVAWEKEEPKPEYIDEALRYIKESYREKLTVADIAKRAHISPSYLFTAFKKRMGVSPISFLNNYRLSLAAELLQGTERSIAEIASRVGISDAVYFNKMFKKHFEMSPSEYRSCYISRRNCEDVHLDLTKQTKKTLI